MSDIPQWILDYATDVRDLIGINDWDIAFRIVDDPDTENTAVAGQAHVNTRYRSALIKLRRDYLAGHSEDEVKALVFHELFHVALDPAANNVERIIELLPKELQAHAWELWHDGSEQVIEITVRALRRTIKPTVEEQDNATIPQEASSD